MKPETFNEILERRLELTRSVLKSKSDEYASQSDRLYNFRKAAEINGTTVAEALWGMASKHLVSVLDLVSGKGSADQDIVDEKIGDMVNYLILLEAVFNEFHNEQEGEK